MSMTVNGSWVVPDEVIRDVIFGYVTLPVLFRPVNKRWDRLAKELFNGEIQRDQTQQEG